MFGLSILNSGEDWYLLNSDFQSSSVVGGRLPVTGFHSVILRLEQLAPCPPCRNIAAYPDSVSRVRPPKTTIPNTLAALPSSQYATDFSLLLGKKLLFVFLAFCPIDLLKDDKDGEEPASGARLLETAVDRRLALDLKALISLGKASLKSLFRVATRGRGRWCGH